MAGRPVVPWILRKVAAVADLPLVVLVEAINQAQALRTAAQDALNSRSAPVSLTAADVRAMVGALGDVGQALNRAEPTKLGLLYEALRIEAMYDAEARVVTVTIRPAHVAKTCVRGGTSTLPPPTAGTTLTHSWDTAPTH